MRMPVIAAAVGGLALGAFVVAGSRYMTSPVQASIPAPSLGSTQLVSQGAGLESNPVLVDCADGQRALVRHVSVAGQTVAQVQCVGQPLMTSNSFDEMSMAAAPAYNTARAYPVSMSHPASYSAPAPARRSRAFCLADSRRGWRTLPGTSSALRGTPMAIEEHALISIVGTTLCRVPDYADLGSWAGCVVKVMRCESA